MYYYTSMSFYFVPEAKVMVEYASANFHEHWLCHSKVQSAPATSNFGHFSALFV